MIYAPPLSAELRQELAESLDPPDEVLVRQSVGEAAVAGRTEGLAGHEGDAGLLEHELGELEGGRRPRAPKLTAEHRLEGREGVEGPLRLEADDPVDRPRAS